MTTQKSLDKKFKQPAGLGERPTDERYAVKLGISADNNKLLNKSIKTTLTQHDLLDPKLYSKHQPKIDPTSFERQIQTVGLLETIFEKVLTPMKPSGELKKEEVMYVLREKALSRSYNHNRTKSVPRRQATGVELLNTPEDNLLMSPMADPKGDKENNQMPKPQAKHTSKPDDGKTSKSRPSIRPSLGPVSVSGQPEDQKERQASKAVESQKKDSISGTKTKPNKGGRGNAVDLAPLPTIGGLHDHQSKTPKRQTLPISTSSTQRKEKATVPTTFTSATINVKIDGSENGAHFRASDIVNASKTADSTVEHLSFDSFWDEVERQANVNRLDSTLSCYWPDEDAGRQWVDVTDETRWRAVLADCHEEGVKRWQLRVTIE
ncbi:hypothetical protein HBI64_100150 [Parastagonospora nodorum]|nr:hypothetical protein HBI64_100150 [Parastagonospora nodorum]